MDGTSLSNVRPFLCGCSNQMIGKIQKQNTAIMRVDTPSGARHNTYNAFVLRTDIVTTEPSAYYPLLVGGTVACGTLQDTHHPVISGTRNMIITAVKEWHTAFCETCHVGGQDRFLAHCTFRGCTAIGKGSPRQQKANAP